MSFEATDDAGLGDRLLNISTHRASQASHSKIEDENLNRTLSGGTDHVFLFPSPYGSDKQQAEAFKINMDATWCSAARSMSSESLSFFCNANTLRIMKFSVCISLVVMAAALGLLYVLSNQKVTASSLEQLVVGMTQSVNNIAIPTPPTHGSKIRSDFINVRSQRQAAVLKMQDEEVKTGTVTCSKDLEKLGSCSKIVIYRLTDSDPEIPSNIENEQVETLDVVGPTTEGWLECLLTSLVNVETLTLDIDELCRAETSEDRLELPILHLPRVRNLIIKKASMCPSFLAEWILRWELPNLKNLHIRKTDIYKATLAQLESFASRTSSLVDVHFSNVYLCSGCKLSGDLDKKISREDLMVLELPYDGEK